MNLVITDTIFDDFPELVLGVVILQNIDNTQNKTGITDMLRQAEAAARELADLVQLFCGGTVTTAFLDKDNRQIKLI